jgi:hypothetical protein
MKKIILIALVVAVVIAGAVYFYVFHKPARTAASEDAKYALSATELVSAFEANENTANAKYLNQIVKVSGSVASIAQSKDEISVSLQGDGMGGVTCSFGKESLDTTKVKAGDKVFIKGICSGYLMDVVLNKCDLVSEDSK